MTSAAAAEWAEDYRALRGSSGWIRRDRDLFRLSGSDAVSYLQGQCSQDVEALVPGACAEALLLSPQGKLDALVRVLRAGPEELIVDTDGGFGPVVVERLERFRLRVDVVVEPLAWRCLGVRGPEAAERVGHPGGVVPVPPAGVGALVAVLPAAWPGSPGLDLIGPEPPVPPGVRACDERAWEALRIEAGVPRMGSELDERTIAAEAGLIERCVSTTKGCYTGQELVARLEARGNRVARRLAGVVLGAGEEEVPAGAGILAGGQAVGHCTSVSWSPALDRYVALAYVHRSVTPPATVTVLRGGDATPGEVGAEVRPLPLVG